VVCGGCVLSTILIPEIVQELTVGYHVPMTLPELEQQIHDEFPDFKVVPKSSSSLMRAIDIFLKVITFGLMKTFMTRFITTVGYTVYVNRTWGLKHDVAKMLTLRHERVHMRQRRKYGSFLFTFLYLFFPVPVLFAYYRRKFEMEAYEETMLSMLELLPLSGEGTLMTPVFKEIVVRHFTTAEYFWMWPWRSSVERWYDETLARLRSS